MRVSFSPVSENSFPRQSYLALVDEEVDVLEQSQGEFIIPAKVVNELNRLF